MQEFLRNLLIYVLFCAGLSKWFELAREMLRVDGTGCQGPPAGEQGQLTCWWSPWEQSGLEIFMLAEIASPQSIF